MAKKTSTKKTAKQTPAAKARLMAQVVKLRTEDQLSFRAIEKKLARKLGLDPNRAFGGFVAFRLFNDAQ